MIVHFIYFDVHRFGVNELLEELIENQELGVQLLLQRDLLWVVVCRDAEDLLNWLQLVRQLDQAQRELVYINLNLLIVLLPYRFQVSRLELVLLFEVFSQLKLLLQVKNYFGLVFDKIPIIEKPGLSKLFQLLELIFLAYVDVVDEGHFLVVQRLKGNRKLIDLLLLFLNLLLLLADADVHLTVDLPQVNDLHHLLIAELLQVWRICHFSLLAFHLLKLEHDPLHLLGNGVNASNLLDDGQLFAFQIFKFHFYPRLESNPCYTHSNW